MRGLRRPAVWAALATAGLALAPQFAGNARTPAKRAPTAITCTWPVGSNDTAASLLRRFGRQARMADIGIGEGETERGVELFPNDPRRRLSVLFWDPQRRKPQSVQAWSDDAPWTVAGIRMGDSLESLRQRNGRPILFQQFGADYGGTLHSFEGGTFANTLGACEPSLLFTSNAEAQIPDELTGDGQATSDHPEIGKAKVTVTMLGVRFDPPPEMQQN